MSKVCCFFLLLLIFGLKNQYFVGVQSDVDSDGKKFVVVEVPRMNTPNFFFNSDWPRQLLVRDIYPTFNKMMQENTAKHFLITGNPGIGKT